MGGNHSQPRANPLRRHSARTLLWAGTAYAGAWKDANAPPLMNATPSFTRMDTVSRTLTHQGGGSGRLVLPVGRQLAHALVVAGQAVDAALHLRSTPQGTERQHGAGRHSSRATKQVAPVGEYMALVIHLPQQRSTLRG